MWEVAKEDLDRVEDNSGSSKGVVRTWHSDSLKKVQLTYSQDNKTKKDEVVDDDDDDAGEPVCHKTK